MPTVLIAGGTGLIGKRVTELLVAKNYEVIILSRDHQLPDKNNSSKISYANWDIEKGLIDKDAIAKADFIIHLAGAGVADKRWTQKRKKVILESRTKSSAVLIKALTENKNKVKAVISASAIGWYGPDNEASLQDGFREDTISKNDFLGETCKLWEESIAHVEALGKRLVKLRTGIVLSNKGGALAEFIKPLKAFVAAILGTGKQMISWIHVDDICRMYIYAIENDALHGVYNAVAPTPVSNKTLTLQLARIMQVKFYIPVYVPSFLLKLILGEMSIEVLKSTTVSCKKIKDAGFTFLYADIDAALKEIISRK